MPKTAPTNSAARNPTIGEGTAVVAAMAVKAPIAIRPSTPRLTTPTRSASTSPSAASAKTPPARKAVVRRPVRSSMVLSPSRLVARNAVMGNLVADRRQKQDQSRHRQHGRCRQALRLQDDPGIEDEGHQRCGKDDADGG